MTSCVRIVGFGVDTLVLNIYPTDSAGTVVKRRVDDDLQEELRVLKERAQAEEEDIVTRFVFGGNLLMRTKGSEGFNWILHNNSITLAVNRGSKMGLLGQVRFSSEYLWTVGHLDKAISDVHLFLMTVFGDDIFLQLSNLDLALDVIGLNVGTVAEVKEHFITRAQLDDQMPVDVSDGDGMIDGPDRIKRRWRRITGLPFGARNGQVSALLYDKTHEITYKSPQKAWFHDMWLSVKQDDGSPVWDGEAAVWRIEMRFKRRALHEFKQENAEGEVVFHGIENAYDLMERLPLLWSYAVGHVGGGADGLPDGWLRYVVPTEDTNRSRWPVHPDWQVIQSAFQPVEVQEESEEEEREAILQEVDEERAVHPMVTSFTRKKVARPAAAGSGVPESEVPVAAPAIPLHLRPIVRKRHYEVNMRRMVAQVAGCALTTEAWRPYVDGAVPDEIEDADLSVTFHFLFDRVVDYLEEKQQRDPKWSYVKSVQRKRVVYQLEQAAVA